MAILTGTGINEVPTNGDLGTMAYQNADRVQVVDLTYSGVLTGGTGVINIGSGQIYKDVAGNLGLGVVPSAWGAPWKALDISNRASLAFGFDETNLGYNLYRLADATFRYKETGFASVFRQDPQGGFTFNTAPSGTAGSPITFTKVLQIDNLGNHIKTVNTAAPSLTDNNTMAVSLPNNTTLRFHVRGSDGVTRTADLALT